MSDEIEQKDISMGKITKKMSKKTTAQIPLDALGFKAKVFYDATYQYIPRRKQNRFAKYEKQKRQQNFRTKLSCIIDPSHATYEQIGDLKFNKRSQWKKINYIVYRTKQLLTCCICLTKEFIAPQMTFCGHVFCWHCILMHYEKSLKANYCPVCNQVFEIQQLRTCDTLYLPPILQGQKIKLKLKIRNLDQKITFNPQNFQQQTAFSHIVRMKNASSLQKFIQENQEIIKQMKQNQDPQCQKYLGKILEKSQTKIENMKKIILEEKSNHYKPHKHEVFSNGTLCQILLPEDLVSDKIIAFYQQESGRSVFLHPICEKYLRKNFTSQSLPYKLEQQVILKQQTQYSGQNIKKYKYLNHLPQNQEIDFVFIRMNELLDYRLLDEFEKELQMYKKKRQQIVQRQQQYAKLLNEKYQKQQVYMRELKKMQQSMFHDIKVPTNMVDLNEIQDTNIFPSLVRVVSGESNSESVSMSDSTSQVSGYTFQSTKTKNKGKKNQFKLKQEDFPGLELALKMSMDENSKQQEIHVESHISRTLSQNPFIERQKPQHKKSLQQTDFPDMISSRTTQKKAQPHTSTIIQSKKKNDQDQQQQSNKTKRKGKKKNKEKFVDVTHQFFSRQQEDD